MGDMSEYNHEAYPNNATHNGIYHMDIFKIVPLFKIYSWLPKISGNCLFGSLIALHVFSLLYLTMMKHNSPKKNCFIGLYKLGFPLTRLQKRMKSHNPLPKTLQQNSARLVQLTIAPVLVVPQN